VRILDAFGIPFESLSPKRKIPRGITVILTSEEEYPQIKHRNKVVAKGVEGTLVQVKSIAEHVEGEGLIIGIDPGEQIGMAVVSKHGRALLVLTAHDIETTASAIASIVSTRPAGGVTVNVGSGAPTIRDRILRSLRSLSVRLCVVDETKTSPRSKYSRSDEIAALKIALLQGQEVTEMPLLDPTPGEVREIQRRSRIVSGGKLTLPTGIARSVALGELTLDEAVKEYGKRKGN
jgi:hypothetical protein